MLPRAAGQDEEPWLEVSGVESGVVLNPAVLGWSQTQDQDPHREPVLNPGPPS